jgi:hypothetical protein
MIRIRIPATYGCVAANIYLYSEHRYAIYYSNKIHYCSYDLKDVKYRNMDNIMVQKH